MDLGPISRQMAEPLRVQYPGAVYHVIHVMVRRSHGQKIFDDNQDRQRFLKTLEKACQETGGRVHAYVLMGTNETLTDRVSDPGTTHSSVKCHNSRTDPFASISKSTPSG